MDNACGQGSGLKGVERGAARLKFILIIALIAVLGYVGFQYIPVAYQGERFKGALQKAVNDADTLGQSNEALRTKIISDAKQWDIPADAEITTERTPEGRFKAHVQYKRPVIFFGYTHTYSFDHTATSTGFGLGGK